MRNNLALKLNPDSPELESYVVYFGGKSPAIDEEVKQISESLMAENAANIFYGFSDRVIIPVFERLHPHAGTMTTNVEKMVQKSQAYMEIIGDGFGDTSFDLAYAAYKTARNWRLPIGVLVKEDRTHNPKYANSFLELFEEDITTPIKLIIPYTTPSDAATKVNDFLKETFKI